MQFKQKVTWATVALMLGAFLFATLFVMTLLVADIERSGGLIANVLGTASFLGISLAAIAARLGDLDTDLYSSNSWYQRPNASRGNLFFDPDP